MDAEAGEAGVQQPAGAASTSTAAVPFDRSSSRLGAPGAESFDGALRELKDLRSQLHEAADCCAKAFLSTDKKKMILEGTKGYICDAVVAVIDHLGTVSSKLEHKLQERTEVAQTERKINFLKQVIFGPELHSSLSLRFYQEISIDICMRQGFAVVCSLRQRLLTCEQYAVSLKLLSVRGDPDAIRYHRRYISQLKMVHDFRKLLAQQYLELPSLSSHMMFNQPSDVHVVLGDHKKKGNHGSNILSFLKKTRR
ncbi:Protein ABIL3 [Zea mays]|uniref:Protein ABIL3 n=1 Tax=Zea mays TaxID=4577 RepID=A0A1D6GB32_MAIZE|nr:Protein ABIL3 [Zea mays]